MSPYAQGPLLSKINCPADLRKLKKNQLPELSEQLRQFIIDIVSEKEKASVYYHWEGSREEGGPVYHFYAMELIYFHKKTELIYKIETLWSEKQFMDQFK